MPALDPAERKRLVAIMGMLGSDSPGERNNAARLAERFRREHKLTWDDLFDPSPPVPPESTPPPMYRSPEAREPATRARAMTAEQERAQFMPLPKDIKGRWMAVVYFSVCAVVTFFVVAATHG